MIPFIDIGSFDLGPLEIQPFGVLTALGVLFGTSVAARYANRYRYDEEDLRWLGVRLVVWGFIVCHLVDVFFYTPGRLKDDPWLVLRIWEGIASYGGILGGSIAFVVYTHLRKMDPLRYSDAIAYGFALGMAFGRAGCAVAHDHIGVRTDFFLAVDVPKHFRMPDGGPSAPAHDLGLYEMFLWVFIFLVMTVLIKVWKGRRPGALVVVGGLLYAPVRFFFEYLRFPHTDPRYLGLTPAQHLAIATVIALAFVIRRIVQNGPQPLTLPDPSQGHASEPSSRPKKGGGKAAKKNKKH